MFAVGNEVALRFDCGSLRTGEKGIVTSVNERDKTCTIRVEVSHGFTLEVVGFEEIELVRVQHNPWDHNARCDRLLPDGAACQLAKNHAGDHVWFGDAKGTKAMRFPEEKLRLQETLDGMYKQREALNLEIYGVEERLKEL